MVPPSAGAVVLVTFPFSDLSQAKLRPAVGWLRPADVIGSSVRLLAMPILIRAQLN
jgi:hypothetical protein